MSHCAPPQRSLVAVLGTVLLVGAAVRAQTGADIPPTADGRPDLSGTYDVATLTPLQRPESLGDRLTLTDDEAQKVATEETTRLTSRAEASDPEREVPPAGGDGSPGAAGNVGGYNSFWTDRGSGGFKLDGLWRTSIIVDPANGRRPPMTPEARQKRAKRFANFRRNTGEAWWLENEGPGPYDDPELRPMGERCILGFGSTQGPPMLPVLYNNFKRIVQTPDHVMILIEMNHDARIVRMNAEHEPPEIRRWLGDSVGHWQGDTLVVDTTNFTKRPGLGSASENLHVVERFSRIDKDTLRYQFTVDDPSVWTGPWSGEYPWPASDGRVYEYACHEGNYALGNILRGARLLEAEAEKGTQAKTESLD